MGRENLSLKEFWIRAEWPRWEVGMKILQTEIKIWKNFGVNEENP